MKTKIYLAGGFQSDWQDKVRQFLGDSFIYLDPKEKERPKTEEPVLMTVEEYGTWDLHQIKQCDIFFGYMERTNPSGIGLAVESGFAKGLNKTVIMVLEPDNETIKDRYLQFLKKSADITFNDFQQGLTYLYSYK